MINISILVVSRSILHVNSNVTNQNLKLVISECNDLYFIAIAFIAFTLHEVKQCQVFFWDTRYNSEEIDQDDVFTSSNSISSK
jgi:hypothetical protein